MPSVPFGAIKALQARTGADRATCKKALEENGCDEDAAAAAIGEHTSVAAASSSKPSEAQAQLDSWAAQEQAASVSIVRQQAGDGETFPMVGDMCTMHYEGTLQSDGTVFDSSIKRNKPFRFKVGVADVIRGWDVGVMKMSLGEKAVLLIGPDYACTHPLTCMYCRVIHTLHLGYVSPPACADGASGVGPIPPNAHLKFEVELLRIERRVQRDGAVKCGLDKEVKQPEDRPSEEAGTAAASGAVQSLVRRLIPSFIESSFSTKVEYEAWRGSLA